MAVPALALTKVIEREPLPLPLTQTLTLRLLQTLPRLRPIIRLGSVVCSLFLVSHSGSNFLSTHLQTK